MVTFLLNRNKLTSKKALCVSPYLVYATYYPLRLILLLCYYLVSAFAII